MVLYYTHGNELRQVQPITGAPHGVIPSLIICWMCVYTWGGFSTHFLAIKWGFTLS